MQRATSPDASRQPKTECPDARPHSSGLLGMLEARQADRPVCQRCHQGRRDGNERFVRRLSRDADGQVLLGGAVLALAALACLLALPNVTYVIVQKVQAQTAADAGAFTGSIWLARALNLTAGINIGIRSVYEWETVLTVGEALAQALYSDTLDPSVRAMGQGITLALFGSSNPVTVHSVEYPASIRMLDSTVRWLSALQDDIVSSFQQVAARMGTDAACSNMNVRSPSQTAGGWTLAPTDTTIPLLVSSVTGDSLLYEELDQLAAGLESIPTGDSNVGPAEGMIVISPVGEDTTDIWAYYGASSAWYDVKQWAHYYMDYIQQVFQDTRTGRIDTGYRFFKKPGDPPWNDYKNVKLWPDPRQPGDSWVARYDTTATFHILDARPGNNKYKIDTCVYVTHRVPKWLPLGPWNWTGYESGDSILTLPGLESLGLVYDSSKVIPTGFYSGAESTVGYVGPKVRPRRVNPNRGLYTVSYVWRQGASSSPYGPAPPMGGIYFARGAVAAMSPLFTVARAEPYLTVSDSSGAEYFFAPSWDVRLTPLDSLGVAEIINDTAYAGHSRGSFDNLQNLRRCALLP